MSETDWEPLRDKIVSSVSWRVGAGLLAGGLVHPVVDKVIDKGWLSRLPQDNTPLNRALEARGPGVETRIDVALDNPRLTPDERTALKARKSAAREQLTKGKPLTPREGPAALRKIRRAVVDSPAARLLDAKKVGYVRSADLDLPDWSKGDASQRAIRSSGQRKIDAPTGKRGILHSKTRLGILDMDHDRIKWRGSPDKAALAAVADYKSAGGGAKGIIRSAKGVAEATLEMTPLHSRLMRMGFPSREERLLRRADAMGLSGKRAIDYIRQQSGGRFGQDYYPTQKGAGGEFVRSPEPTKLKPAPADFKNVSTTKTQAPRPEFEEPGKVGSARLDEDALSRGRRELGRLRKYGVGAIPVVGALDDVTVVGKDIAEGDYGFAAVHLMDAGVDYLGGGLVPLGVNLALDALSGESTRGVVSGLLANVGITEETESSGLISDVIGAVADALKHDETDTDDDDDDDDPEVGNIPISWGGGSGGGQV